jgi:hypothetical protein
VGLDFFGYCHFSRRSPQYSEKHHIFLNFRRLDLPFCPYIAKLLPFFRCVRISPRASPRTPMVEGHKRTFRDIPENARPCICNFSKRRLQAIR